MFFCSPTMKINRNEITVIQSCKKKKNRAEKKESTKSIEWFRGIQLFKWFHLHLPAILIALTFHRCRNRRCHFKMVDSNETFVVPSVRRRLATRMFFKGDCISTRKPSIEIVISMWARTYLRTFDRNNQSARVVQLYRMKRQSNCCCEQTLHWFDIINRLRSLKIAFI